MCALISVLILGAKAEVELFEYRPLTTLLLTEYRRLPPISTTLKLGATFSPTVATVSTLPESEFTLLFVFSLLLLELERLCVLFD